MKVRRFASFGNLALGAGLMLLVWALLVFVASRPALKTLVDLTPQQVNSVDPATEELLRELREQKAAVEFHIFAPILDGEAPDDATRQAMAIRRRLVELTRLLLVRYRYLGGDGVTVLDYDFYGQAAATRQAAQEFDYKPGEGEVVVVAVRMPGKERRFRKLSIVSDLAVIDLPGAGMPAGPIPKAKVPVLKQYQGETAISSALKSLLVTGVPVAYVLRDYSTAVDFGNAGAMSYGGLLAALQRSGFDVRMLSFRDGTGVPPDAALVLVLEPKQEFTPRDATALFDYCKRGGRLFLNYAWGGIVSDMNPTGGQLGQLLGFELSVAPVYHRIPDTNNRSGGRSLDGDDAVARLQLLCNRDHPVTRRMAEVGRPLEVWSAREVRVPAGAPKNITRVPLLQTHGEGWLAAPGDDGFPSNRSPRIGLRAFEVAMALEVPPPVDGNGAPASGARSGQVVVLGGLMANNAGVQAGFGDFVVNTCNWMAERKVLLDIEGSRYEAKFLQLAPQQLQRLGWLLVWGVPGTFLVCGLLVVWLRRRQ